MGHYYSPFSLRIPEGLVEKIKFIANKNKRSATKEMEYIIQLYVDNWEKEHEVISIDTE